MATDIAALEKEMIDWVVAWSEGEPGATVDPEANLLDSGLLDSMSLMGLINFLEARLNIMFDFEDFDPIEDSSIRGLIANCLKS